MPGFQRVNPLGAGFIRGPARILVAPVTSVYPANLSAIINLSSTGYTTCVQTITISGSPTGGTFLLQFNGNVTSPLTFNAAASVVQAALQALPGIGAGGCTVALASNVYTVTFAGAQASAAQPLFLANATGLTGGTSPAIAVAQTTAGFGLYDPVGSWTELGSTRSGIRIARNNTETMIDVDQIQASLLAIPDEWEMTVETTLAETTEANLQLAWQGGAITQDATQTPSEQHLGMGNPSAYTQNRVAVVHKKTIGTSANLIRAHTFRIATRSPVSSNIEFAKSGNQATIPFTFRAFADPTIADPTYSMGEIIEQNIW